MTQVEDPSKYLEKIYNPLKKVKSFVEPKMAKSLLGQSFLFTIFFSIAVYVYFYFFPSMILPRSLSFQLYGERCTDEWTLKNVSMLKQSLDANVFGQHIATKLLLSTLSQRWLSARRRKPLVMSFHGWTGSGKNYITKFIAESLFEKGLASKFVHLFVSTLHFPDAGQSSQYRRQLQDWVRSNVSICRESVFVFDEIDKMPSGVIDGLRSYMDFHDVVDGVDFRSAIFIFLSNTGGREITKKAYEFWTKGRDRLDIAYVDLEDLISRGAFNEQGGLHHSDIIDRSLIDLYVPFLPLERRHVRQCAERELLHRGKDPKTYPHIVDQATDQIHFWPEKVEVFATAGCKRVSQKIDELLFSEDH